MKLVTKKRVYTLKLSQKGKDYLGYILAILFLAGIIGSPIILSYLYYFI